MGLALRLGLGLGGVSSSALAAAPSLDFTTGTLDPRITFSRASSGTYFDASGVLQLASTNSARFDHDPVTLAAKGLLIEEARTNLFPYSTNINANWSANNDASVDAYAAAPDGTTTATRVLDNSAGGTGGVGHTRNVTITNTRHCFSFFAKSEQLSWVCMQITGFTSATLAGVAYFDLQNGVVGATNQIEATIQNCGNGWYRCVGYVVPDAGDLSGNFNILCADTNNDYVVDRDGTSSVLIWGAQLEAGSFPTSYIPTAGSTVTRAADGASMTGTNFSSWYATDNTIVVEASSPASGTRIIWQADDGTANNRATLYTSGTSLKLDIVTGGVSQASLTLGTIFANTAFKAAFALKTNDVAASLNGAAQVTDASVTLPTVDRCRFGSDTTGNQLCEHIKSFTRYASRLADVQGLSA